VDATDRYLKAMLMVNLKQARESFLTVQQPSLQQPQCQDALLDDLPDIRGDYFGGCQCVQRRKKRKRDDWCCS